MAATESKDVHKWTSEETRRLIRFRAENEKRFLKSRAAAKQLWETLVKELGLEGKITSQQASKKWENLKKKYKDLKTPKTGSGTDAGEATASNWQFFEEMHEVLGARPSIDPPVVVASFAPDDDLVTLHMETIEPTTNSTPIPASSVAASISDASASVVATVATPTPSPRKRKRKSNPILDFLVQESVKEQKRHKESEKKTERFLNLFEKLTDKI